MKFTYSLLFIVFLFISNLCFGQVANCQSHKFVSTATSLYPSSENLRSDTFDILKYTINLDITDFSNQIIRGNTVVRFTPKLNLQSKISLDLLKMTSDSIVQNATQNLKRLS